MDINYDAGTYNDFRGKAIPVTGTYNVWAIENMFYYVLDKDVPGGNLDTFRRAFSTCMDSKGYSVR